MLDTSFVYIVEEGRGYQTLTLDEKKNLKMADDTLVDGTI